MINLSLQLHLPGFNDSLRVAFEVPGYHPLLYSTEYPIKCAYGFVVLCFVVVWTPKETDAEVSGYGTVQSIITEMAQCSNSSALAMQSCTKP